MTKYVCSNHRCRDRGRPADHVDVSRDGLAVGVTAGLCAGLATKNIWAALGLALAGALVGHLIDTEISPRCPICGEIMKAILSEGL